jgi:hypothetical protein
MAEEGTISIEWSVELSRAEPQCHRYSAQGQSPLFPHIRSLINLKRTNKSNQRKTKYFFANQSSTVVWYRVSSIDPGRHTPYIWSRKSHATPHSTCGGFRTKSCQKRLGHIAPLHVLQHHTDFVLLFCPLFFLFFLLLFSSKFSFTARSPVTFVNHNFYFSVVLESGSESSSRG